MRSLGITIGIFFKFLLVENVCVFVYLILIYRHRLQPKLFTYYFCLQRILPIYYETEAPVTDQDTLTMSVTDVDNSNEKTIPKLYDDDDSGEYLTKRRANVGTFEKVRVPSILK